MLFLLLPLSELYYLGEFQHSISSKKPKFFILNNLLKPKPTVVGVFTSKNVSRVLFVGCLLGLMMSKYNQSTVQTHSRTRTSRGPLMDQTPAFVIFYFFFAFNLHVGGSARYAISSETWNSWTRTFEGLARVRLSSPCKGYFRHVVKFRQIFVLSAASKRNTVGFPVLSCRR